MRSAEGLLQLGLACIRSRQEQVRADGRVEDVGLLSSEGEDGSDFLLAVFVERMAGDGHRALLGIEEAEQEVRHCRLAGAAWSDERDPPSRIEAEREAAQRRLLIPAVAGGDIL